MTPGQAPSTKEEILAILRLHWESDKRISSLMTAQSAGMVYDIFGEFPEAMPPREKAIVRQLNDLEVKLIELEGKLMGLSSGFTALQLLPSMFGQTPPPALQAAHEFAALLHSYARDILDITTTSHKLLLEVREKLFKHQ